MPKTTNLNLELTTDASTHFEDWRKSVNGQGTTAADYSNTQLIDDFAGTLSGGTTAQYLGKQTAEDFEFEWKSPDTTPIAESSSLITSGGVKLAIDVAKQAVDTGSSQTVLLTGDVLYELFPDVYYNFTGALTSLTLTFRTPVIGRENEYKGQFISGDVPPTVVFPNTIIWVKDFIIAANKTYQFSIVNNIGVIVGV